MTDTTFTQRFQIFLPGEKVYLVNDKKREEFEIVARAEWLSRGPMGQFPPSLSYICRKPTFGYDGHYDYNYFRADALHRFGPPPYDRLLATRSLRPRNARHWFNTLAKQAWKKLRRFVGTIIVQ